MVKSVFFYSLSLTVIYDTGNTNVSAININYEIFCCLNLGYFNYPWRERNIYIRFFIPSWWRILKEQIIYFWITVVFFTGLGGNLDSWVEESFGGCNVLR